MGYNAGELSHGLASPGETRDARVERYLLKALTRPDLDLAMSTGTVLSYENRDYLLVRVKPVTASTSF